VRVLFPAIALLTLLAALPVRADDWSVTRSAFDPRLVARYKAMLRRNPTDARALSQLVSMYGKHRSLMILIKEYRALAKASPGKAGPHYILGRLDGRTGHWDQAAARFMVATSFDKDNDRYHAAYAGALEKLGKTAEAQAAYLSALSNTKKVSRKKQYLRALAHLALIAGDHAKALAHTKALHSLSPRSRELTLNLARAHVNAGDPKAALKLLARLIARTRDAARKAELLKEAGKVAAAAGEHEEAVALFRKAMALTTRGHWLRRELTEEIISIHRQRETLPELIKDFKKRWKRPGAFEHQVFGRLYDETGDEEKALAAYRAALKGAPHEVRVWLRVIALLDRSGRSKDAVEAYRGLVRVAPGEPRHQIELAKRLKAGGRQKEAQAMLDRCGRRFPSDASVQSALADLFARWGDQTRALARSKALVRLEPREPNHLINLGEQYDLLGDREKAMRTWARLLKVIPKRHAALARLAEVYAQHHMTDRATTLLRKAIKLSPATVAYHRSLALLLESSGQTGQALATWYKVRELVKGNKKEAARRVEVEARARIITISRKTYQLRLLLRKLSRELRQGKRDREKSLLLAEGFLRLESLEPAAQVYRSLLVDTPDDTELLLALERVYRKQRKLDDAVKLLKRLARLRPADARDFYQRAAELLLRMGRDSEALALGNMAVAAAPSDAPTLVRMGQLLEKKEDHEAAAKSYQQAIENDPGHVPAYFALARLSSRGGDLRRAEKLYRSIIGQARNPEQVRRAFRLGVTMASYLGTLGQLERQLLPRALSGLHREVFRELLVEVYRRTTRPLIHMARRGRSEDRKAAAAGLTRLGRRGLAPLLEELALESREQGEIVRILGYLGNGNAALPLLRIAAREQEEVLVVRGTANSRLRRLPPLFRRHRRASRWSYSSRRANLKVEATVAAGRLSDMRSAPTLTKLLASRDGPLRDAAAWALGRAANEAVVKPLFKALGDNRVTVQVMACAGLGKSGDPRMRPVLEEVMGDLDRTEEVRVACAWGLGALGHPASVPRLLSALRDGDGELQRAAALALGAIGHGGAVPGLLEALWPRRSRVRQAILAALNRLTNESDGGGPRPTLPDVLVQNGRILLADFMERLMGGPLDGASSPVATGEKLVKLIEAHGAALARGIGAALERHTDLVLRILADLDDTPGRASLGPLTPGLARLAPAEQLRLVGAIQQACAPLSKNLLTLANHREARVRVLALRVLAKVAPASLPGALLRSGLADAEWRVQVAALDALSQVNGAGVGTAQGAMELALSALTGGHWRRRERAARLVASLAPGPASPGRRALARAARKDPNGFVRQAAVEGLGGLAGDASIKALAGALSDPAPPVRAAVCAALGRHGNASAKALLDRGIKDPISRVREACKEARNAGQ